MNHKIKALRILFLKVFTYICCQDCILYMTNFIEWLGKNAIEKRVLKSLIAQTEMRNGQNVDFEVNTLSINLLISSEILPL